MHVALIYDDTERPDTTGVYCRRALEQLTRVDHFRRSEIGSIPEKGYDLYLNIDDGLRYRIPVHLRPSAWWMIDTHMDFPWYRAKAPDFDFTFAAQREGAEQLRKEGAADPLWLPLACDPHVHRKHDLPKAIDVCFVGNVFPGPRAELLDVLQARYANAFVGRCYFKEMARKYSTSRIVFNRSIRNDVNMRVFEALACGSLLVTNDLSAYGLGELFRDGQHLATYRTPEELCDKVDWHLAHADLRERMAARGRRDVLARHTYRHRMTKILDAVRGRMPACGAKNSGEGR
jgi:glycosyltransferase involved in cell wall biosynthesis